MIATASCLAFDSLPKLQQFVQANEAFKDRIATRQFGYMGPSGFEGSGIETVWLFGMKKE